MIILRCTNDNNVVQDLQVQEQIDLRLDISAIENATIGDVYGISSQEFSIPGTDEVNQFFGNLYSLASVSSVALQNSIDCQVLLDGGEVFTGKLYIKNIITDSDGYGTLYNVIVVNETVDFKFELQDTYLNQLDFSQYDHNLTYANVSQSWGGNLLNGDVVYPFVNYGKPEGDPNAPDYAFASFNFSGSNTIDNYSSPLRLIDFKPAIRAKSVVDTIFSGSSYGYTSSFFDSTYFNNLYLLATPNDQLGPNNVSPVSQSAWAYISSSEQFITAGTITKVDFDAEVVDNANNFSLVDDRYTADTTGNYLYQISIPYLTQGWAGFNNANTVRIQLRKNGGPIVDTQFYYSIPASGSAFLEGGISLNSGDYLEVEMGCNGKDIKLRNNLGQPSYYPLGNISYFQIKGPASLIGGPVDISEQFPDNLKALDFLQGLIEKFNLVVEPVPNSRNLLRIEPYQTWIDAGKQVNWTDKVDRSERFEITHPITEQPRSIVFSDESDEDILNVYTRETQGVTYGQYTFTSDSDLAEGEKRVGKIFAATPVTGIPNGRQFVIPHLCTVTENNNFKPMKFKPRLLYNNGLQDVPDTALGIQTGSLDRGTIYVRDENSDIQSVNVWNQMSTLTAVPVNYEAGQDLHFNNDLYSPYFQATANGKTKNDAYRTYWGTYINGLYDFDARKLTCNVYLRPNEIQNIALNDKIFIDNSYYRINKINGANLSRRDTVEVELIKLLQFQLKFPRRVIGDIVATLDFDQLSIDGTGRYIDIDTGLPIEDYNQLRQVAAKDGFQLYNNANTGSLVWDYQQPIDNTNQFDQKVLGTNRVQVGASKVNAVGNYNQVKQGSETTLVVGANNLVGENTSNVTAIGQGHSVEALVSNAQILGGLQATISGSDNSVVMGGSGSLFVNNDFSISINGENDSIRDSDYTTAINSHNNEVIINGSGHAVVGLNREGAGLDLLNTRANSNWLGDTYLGGALFRDRVQLECGDGTFISLTGSDYTDGRHENLYILNWSGFSPGTTTIELPNAVNNDYKDVVYQFVANETFDGTTNVDIIGFSGQKINNQISWSFDNQYNEVELTTTGSGWITLGSHKNGNPASQGSHGSFYSSVTQSIANISQSYVVALDGTYTNDNISLSGSGAIVFEYKGTYQLTYVAQVANFANSTQDAYFWVRYNGSDYPNSNTVVSLLPRKNVNIPSTQLATVAFVGEAQNDGDRIELVWGADSTEVKLFSTGSGINPTRPATPSVIANIIHVG